jgi:hypothetical protein
MSSRPRHHFSSIFVNIREGAGHRVRREGTESVSLAQQLSSEPGPKHERRLAPLALAALGVVFGDIGTSPLYAFKTRIHGSQSRAQHVNRSRHSLVDNVGY